MSYTVTEEAASAVRTVLSGLRAVRRRIWSILLQRAAVLLVNIALAAGLVLFLTERNVFLPAGWRIAILAVLAALLALLALWRVAWAARSYGTILKVAAAIDHRRPEFRNRLTSAVELSLVLKARGQYPGIYSGDLLEAALVQAAGLISRPSALRSLAGRVCAVNLKKLRLEYGLAAALAVLFLVSGLLDTRALSAVFHKYRNPLLVLEQERDFKITVRPGNVTLIRGDSLTVQGSGSIALPEPMRIHFRQAGKGTQNQTMLEVIIEVVFQAAESMTVVCRAGTRGLQHSL
ncbi:MAG: hypothetical protein U9P14_08000, partial [Gemmatimonadota bacterium]|nr:hypothetical protein [Gemmatimonadota bacterium]